MSMKLRDYLAKRTGCSNEMIELLNNVIVTLQNRPFMHPENRKMLLEDMLYGMGFTGEELDAFANSKIPKLYQTVPVEVCVKQLYRLYVRVPDDATESQVKEIVKDKVLNGEISDKDLAPDWQKEEEDIVWTEVCWEGAHYE